MKPPAGTQIDWTNPLTKDLGLAVHMTDGRNPVDLVSRETILRNAGTAVLSGIDVASTIAGGFRGVQMDSNSSWQSAGNDRSPSRRVTYTMLAAYKTGFSTMGGPSVDWTSDGINAFNDNGANALNVVIGGTTLATTTSIPTASSFIISGLNRPGGMELWLNGQNDNSNGVDENPAFGGNQEKVTLGDNAIASNRIDGILCLFLMHRRALTPTELVQLHDNPWQIFKPKRIVGISRVTEEVKFSVIKKVRTKQPPAGTPIDWDNPLTRGLGFAFNAAERAAINKTNNEFATASEGVFEPSNDMIGWNIDVGTPVVLQWELAASSSYSGLVEKALANEEHSAFALFSRPSDSGNSEVLYDLHYNNNQRCELSIAINENLSVYSFNISAQGGNYPAADFGTVSSLASTFTQLEHRLYYNGALRIEEADNPVVPALSVYNRIVLNSASATFEGPIYAAYAWSRKLSRSEMESFSANPWQIFEPELIHVPFNEELPKLATFEKEHTRQPR